MSLSLRDRMLRYRAKENIPQTELANRCGVSLQTINAIENEIQNPSGRTLAKIEMVLEESKDAEN